MQKTIEIEGKGVAVEVTDKAVQALSSRHQALLAEIELFFSCLIRKQVRFRETDIPDNATSVVENLALVFRPVMTRACGKDYEGDEPPMTDFPIANTRPSIPKWIKIAFLAGNWRGEFGYDESAR